MTDPPENKTIARTIILVPVPDAPLLGVLDEVLGVVVQHRAAQHMLHRLHDPLGAREASEPVPFFIR